MAARPFASAVGTAVGSAAARVVKRMVRVVGSFMVVDVVWLWDGAFVVG